MSCFCDIPLSRIQTHSAFYGDYGNGLTKKWGLGNKLSPVVYAPPDAHSIQLLKYLLGQWKRCPASQVHKKEELRKHVYRLWSSIKPLSGKMIVAGSPVEKEFYQESEWRYVPESKTMLRREAFDKAIDKQNRALEKFALKFSPSDIRYLLVKSEHEVPKLVDFINTHLGMHPHNDIKLLQTRIFSLDSLAVDM